MAGVRPNSPTASTSVRSSRPRCFRSSCNADITRSSSGTISWCVSKFCPWLSHHARLTRTKGTPASTIRRAISACSPKSVGPYGSRAFADSWDRSKSVSLLIRPWTRA